MRYLIIIFFIFTIQSLNAQVSDTLIKFKLEFYLNDKRMNLDEIEIKFIHLNSDNNLAFHDDIYPLSDSTKNINNLQARENILLEMTSDSVILKKSNGIFQIVTKYKNYHCCPTKMP